MLKPFNGQPLKPNEKLVWANTTVLGQSGRWTDPEIVGIVTDAAPGQHNIAVKYFYKGRRTMAWVPRQELAVESTPRKVEARAYINPATGIVKVVTDRFGLLDEPTPVIFAEPEATTRCVWCGPIFEIEVDS